MINPEFEEEKKNVKVGEDTDNLKQTHYSRSYLHRSHQAIVVHWLNQ